MINGMTILEQTPIIAASNLMIIGVLAGLAIMIFALVYMLVMEAKNTSGHEVDAEKVFINSFKLVFTGALISCIFLFVPAFKTDTGRCTYKCTFEDYVTVNDITEIYEITDVNGDIWTVQDKNIEVR